MSTRTGRTAAAVKITAVSLATVAVLGWAASTRVDAESAGSAPVSTPSTLPTVTVPPAVEQAQGDAAVVVPADRCASTSKRTVLVDLSEQEMWLCRSGSTVLASDVTTGSDEHATPTGTWSVYAKQTDRWLSGEGYSRQVDYWMPFFHGFGFHDSSWQRIPYGSEYFHEDGSHGCVHVPAATMKQLHHWARVGTTVRVVA